MTDDCQTCKGGGEVCTRCNLPPDTEEYPPREGYCSCADAEESPCPDCGGRGAR
jgi:hypothetical protein